MKMKNKGVGIYLKLLVKKNLKETRKENCKDGKD